MRSALPLVVLATLLAYGTDPSAARSDPPDPPVPRTDAGDWNGTWYYESRVANVAIWIRGEPSAPEVKLQYYGVDSAEHFVTDWSGHTTYHQEGQPGEFTLTIEERDANTIRGTWAWRLGRPESARIESARLTMYRAGDGRQLVLLLDDFRREITGSNHPVLEVDHAWSFRKISRREVLWTEIPF